MTERQKQAYRVAVEVYDKLAFIAAAVDLMGENASRDNKTARLSDQLFGLSRILKDMADTVSELTIGLPFEMNHMDK